jgi:SAM-dependent methyltransferase
MDEEWPIADLFDEDYLHFYAAHLADDASDGEASTVWGLLALGDGSNVLDLACGHGRIANRLAAMGARVTGLDATPLFLDVARSDAERRGVSVDYVQGDMRAIPWTDRFDAVVSWFTSYGYFDDAQNRAVLTQVHRALRPGGRFLVELIPQGWASAALGTRNRHGDRRRGARRPARVRSADRPRECPANDRPQRALASHVVLHAAVQLHRAARLAPGRRLRCGRGVRR